MKALSHTLEHWRQELGHLLVVNILLYFVELVVYKLIKFLHEVCVENRA